MEKSITEFVKKFKNATNYDFDTISLNTVMFTHPNTGGKIEITENLNTTSIYTWDIKYINSKNKSELAPKLVKKLTANRCEFIEGAIECHNSINLQSSDFNQIIKSVKKMQSQTKQDFELSNEIIHKDRDVLFFREVKEIADKMIGFEKNIKN